MTEEPQSNAASSVQESIREVVETGGNIRDRVHSIVVDLFRGQNGTVESLRRGVREIIDTATDVVQRSAPDKADSVLKGVMDGISSGVQSVAQAANYALQEATARGQRFAGEDVKRATTDLNAIADIVVESVAHTSERLGTEVGSGVRELKVHANRAVEAIRPAVRETVAALTKHPVQSATEVAGSAVRGGRLIAGAFLGAVSGVLSGAADILDPDKAGKS